jgi:hypothetical protein
MPLTRTQEAAALKYVVVTVFNQPNDGPLMKSLANDSIDHVSYLTSLRDTDIADLKYLEADGNLSAIGDDHRETLVAFCAFIRYRVTQSSPIGDDWISITRTGSNEFRNSPAFDGTIYGNTSVSMVAIERQWSVFK